jgi:hypothetical protein
MRCGQCENGWVFWDEDGHTVKDVCYHCNNTGEIDEELYFRDQLRSVAYALASRQERDYRHAVENDPHGDGYDLHAAEHQLTAHEYFQARVNDQAYLIGEHLLEMSRSEQELLIAWNEMPIERVEKLTIVPPPDTLRDFGSTPPESFYADDDIPF